MRGRKMNMQHGGPPMMTPAGSKDKPFRIKFKKPRLPKMSSDLPPLKMSYRSDSYPCLLQIWDTLPLKPNKSKQ